MASLVLGPLLRYVGRSEATVWVETDCACDVEVLGHTAATFEVYDHHFALVALAGLEEGAVIEYDVRLDGESVWPSAGGEHSASTIHTRAGEHRARLVFGSCRVGAPEREPYTLAPREDEQGLGVDALWAYSRPLTPQSVHGQSRCFGAWFGNPSASDRRSYPSQRTEEPVSNTLIS
jgi:hypothetical protein